MSKRIVAFKKMMALVSVGGASLCLCGLLGGLEGGLGGDLGCVRNADLVAFYQTVGGTAIDSFEANTTGTFGDDFDNIVVAPTVDLVESAYDNWVDRQFPLDPEPNLNNIWRE